MLIARESTLPGAMQLAVFRANPDDLKRSVTQAFADIASYFRSW
jgi:hypothetical protein